MSVGHAGPVWGPWHCTALASWPGRHTVTPMVSQVLAPTSLGSQQEGTHPGIWAAPGGGPLLLIPIPLVLTVSSLEQSLRSLGTPSDTQELRDSL